MLFCSRRASSFARDENGATLVELLVVLTIVSILAVTALPFAENAAQRRHETALREDLRDIRTALDEFHDDWKAGIFGKDDEVASGNGYPLSLATLRDGVKTEDGEVRRYLRAIPVNPFGGTSAGWHLIGYGQLDPTAKWNGEDIYDIRAITDKVGLDGTKIADW